MASFSIVTYVPLLLDTSSEANKVSREVPKSESPVIRERLSYRSAISVSATTTPFPNYSRLR